ncbi:RIP metalloprotease RseP [Opitutaceae bacterium EW11]|nr:RIP metalloprotease RseP [Opitutaceae bacterium EW11]
MDLLHSILSNVWAVFLVVFFFGGSIFVHELGHFLAARRRGAVVERFSIGMGPAIFKWRGKDGVEYWISWLPLGGYVKLPQLADLGPIEGDTTVDVSKLPPITYTTKVLISVAGAVFNMIFAFLLACILWQVGFPTREDITTTRIGYVSSTLPSGSKQQSPASKAGLQPGDVILTVDGKEMRDFVDITQALALSAGRTADGSERLVQLTIRRGSEVMNVDVHPILAGDEHVRKIGIGPAHQIVVGRVAPKSEAERIGLKAGDHIQRVDSLELFSAAQLADYLESHAAGTVALQVQRNGSLVEVTVPPQKQIQDLLGGLDFVMSVQLVHENPVQQLQSILGSTIQSLASLVNPRSDIGISKMTGPIGIVTRFWEAATSEYPVRVAMWFTILINVSLAVFNLLPIPVLDGGHILFATIGKLRGRALPPDFINAAQGVFMVLLFSMLIYVSFFDFRRIVRSERAEPAPAAPAAPEPGK